MFGPWKRKKAPPDGPFYKQRGWLNSAALLGFLVVISIVGILTSDPGGRDADAAAEGGGPLDGLVGPLSPGDPQQVRQGPDGRPEGCVTDDRDTAQPTAAPQDAEWKKLGDLTVPTSPSAGPLRFDAGVWWCFARTPAGAVMAAHVIPVELNGTAWRTVAEQQVVPGKPRDTFVREREAAEGTDPGNGAVPRFAGFSLTSYSVDAATVRLLVADGLGGHVSMSVTVRWRDGDWKVAPQADGDAYSPGTQATPDGFVSWGA
ncbi:hypothetical protein OG946_24665 [Streptomyces sp. NBC_01808]|uniref:hypothetical protein n=1 Tax=Streptomyces sp. NBC_01808 TaxID=2975947 RepID=UPI002DD8666C|nr:hypothetical protein [Streptomyces sp. NBC_01808]WSA40278.1 hypothetical protein OG946_24665 [Streptomyces sp. NBC_01808]